MKTYHLYFYFLKIILLIIICLIGLKFINIDSKIYILIHTIFKISLGLFLILFFSINKSSKKCLDIHDRILFIIAGVILLLLSLPH
jgi:hypothetical protein